MNKRRLGALAVTTMVAGAAMFSGVAGAAEGEAIRTEVYEANAKATALQLRVLGTDLAVTDISSKITSEPMAHSVGSTMLTPLFETTGIEARVAGADGVDAGEANGVCDLDALEAIPGVGRVVDATCPMVRSEILDGNPSSQAIGTQVKLDLSVKELLEALPLDTVIKPVGDATGTGMDSVDDVPETVLDSLEPLVTTLTGAPGVGEILDDGIDTVDELVSNVLGLDTTVRLVVGPAKTVTEATDTEITASAIAQGLRLELFPVSTPFEQNDYDGVINDLGVGDPLLTITLGEAKGAQTYHRDTQVVDPATGEASVVKIRLGKGLSLLDEQILPLLDTLGLGDLLAQVSAGVESVPGMENAEISYTEDPATGAHELVLRGPGEYTLLEGTPLETTIVLSAVDTSVNGFSAAGAVVHTLKGVNGGIYAGLSTISGGDHGDIETTQVLGVTVEGTELARTGATPWIPLMGMVLLGLAISGRRVALRTEA